MFQAVARRLGDGASIPTIEAIAARVMASPQVLPIDTSSDRQGIRRWTSVEMVAIEHRADHERRRRGVGQHGGLLRLEPVLPGVGVVAAVARDVLSLQSLLDQSCVAIGGRGQALRVGRPVVG
jgi:predicted ABC-class ATPase